MPGTCCVSVFDCPMLYPCPGAFETCVRRMRLRVKLDICRRNQLDDPSPFEWDLNPSPSPIWWCASYRESKNRALPMDVEDLVGQLSLKNAPPTHSWIRRPYLKLTHYPLPPLPESSRREYRNLSFCRRRWLLFSAVFGVLLRSECSVPAANSAGIALHLVQTDPLPPFLRRR